MEADINSPKSKGYNCILRCLHYSILMLVACRILSPQTSLTIIELKNYGHLLTYMSIILIILNLLALCYIHCRNKFVRTEFFIAYAINMLFAVVVIALSIVAIGQAPVEQAQNILLQKWGIISSVLLILLTLLILCGNLFWVQRYTNSPGSIIWAYLFLTINWSSLGPVKNIFLFIGITYLVISVVTFFLNTKSLFSSATTTSNRVLKCWWIFCIAVMIVLELVAVAIFFTNHFSNNFYQVAASRLLQLFIVANIIDLLFWLWGLLALRYENGDVIREGLIDANQPVDP